jgi:hypothetical protein
MVGVAGFEPTTPCPPDKCANRAALHSDCAVLIECGAGAGNGRSTDFSLAALLSAGRVLNAAEDLPSRMGALKREHRAAAHDAAGRSDAVKRRAETEAQRVEHHAAD